VFRVEKGDFVYNRLFAWKGSFAVATEANAGCYVSNEFPCFEINKDRADATFLWRYFSRESAWEEALGLSTGGTPTSRNRLKEEKFLAMEIPLPRLSEQRRIVARIEELAVKINEVSVLRPKANEETSALESQICARAWMRSSVTSEFRPLESIADVIDPQPDHRTPMEVPGGMPYVSIANIATDGTIDIFSARKVSPAAIEKQEAAFRTRTGDIVLGKIGTIGQARPLIVNGRFALSANIVLVQPKRNLIHERLLLLLLRSRQIAEQMTTGTNTTAQAAFGIKKMRKLMLPVPRMAEQNQIVAESTALQLQVDALKALQSEIGAEIEALLPSILSKAFDVYP
jgi:type I restriction enzyme S subunit